MPDLQVLHTSRLKLEPLGEAHAAALFEGLSDHRLYEFIGEQAPVSVEALAERYRRLATRMSPDGREHWLNWAIGSQASGRHVGWVQATVHADRSAHVAYLLFRESWGQGFAREAATAMVEHLRDAWSVRIVRATVDVRNRRSIALLEALGFVRGAVRRDAEVIRGVLSDEVEYRRPLDRPRTARGGAPHRTTAPRVVSTRSPWVRRSR